MQGSLEADVLAVAQRWNCSLTEGVAERIGRYFQLLLLWNERLNLTGARSHEELTRNHLADSFAMSTLCPRESEVVDIGAGGGLPGVPFALLRPDCRIALVEPRAKRVAFLRTAIREMGGRNMEVIRCRVEELKSPAFSVAASRATFSPEEWVSIASGLLCPNGRVVLFAASRVEGFSGRTRLVDSVNYRTDDGAPRWAGSFCFT
jgi:16S rRNA (guanine527-N7)-methyltransferase